MGTDLCKQSKDVNQSPLSAFQPTIPTESKVLQSKIEQEFESSQKKKMHNMQIIEQSKQEFSQNFERQLSIAQNQEQIAERQRYTEQLVHQRQNYRQQQIRQRQRRFQLMEARQQRQLFSSGDRLSQQINNLLAQLENQEGEEEEIGLEEYELELIPRSVCLNKNNSNCVICMSLIVLNEQQTFLFCLHNFHTQCILKWLAIKKQCPVCKINIQEHLQSSNNDK